jgi:hypothetical protein
MDGVSGRDRESMTLVDIYPPILPISASLFGDTMPTHEAGQSGSSRNSTASLFLKRYGVF